MVFRMKRFWTEGFAIGDVVKKFKRQYDDAALHTQKAALDVDEHPPPRTLAPIPL
jgi:thioredoxin reductase